MQQFLARLNFLRAYPAEFAEKVLVPMRQYFHSRLLDMGDGPGQRRLTQEGIAALEDAIRYLRNVEPAGPLRLSQPLTRVAANLLRRQLRDSPSATACKVMGHAHGAIGGVSTLAARQQSEYVIDSARKFLQCI